ncbi:hypothetical protein GCM10023153_01570 [Ornithinibacter aureus]|uniref:Uncharacterized protein n=1 Tax=Ornithinibacter aureus TaxID=622664 RepID=A0ABP8J9J4_9MICO
MELETRGDLKRNRQPGVEEDALPDPFGERQVEAEEEVHQRSQDPRQGIPTHDSDTFDDDGRHLTSPPASEQRSPHRSDPRDRSNQTNG